MWDFEKETLQTDQDQKFERMVWAFLSRFQIHISAERKVFFLANFSCKKISHWLSNFFRYPQPLGVCALVPEDCNQSSGTAKPARWRRQPLHCGDVNPCIFRDFASGLMQFQPTAGFVGTLTTQNSKNLRWKSIFFCVFVLRLWWHNYFYCRLAVSGYHPIIPHASRNKSILNSQGFFTYMWSYWIRTR